MALILLPHQRFAPEFIQSWLREHPPPTVREIWLWEHPVFYGDRRGSPHGYAKQRLNPLRVAYSRTLFQSYLETLRKAIAATKVSIREIPEGNNAIPAEFLKPRPPAALHILDPADHLFASRVKRAASAAGIPAVFFHDSPAFLLTRSDLAEYTQSRAAAPASRLNFRGFFEFSKTRLGILKGVASQDIHNRARFPADPAAAPGGRLPEPPMGPAGPAAAGLPLTHAAARDWLARFIRDRLEHFGPYEDAITDRSPFLYHSDIAFLLNFGLLTPREVIDAVVAANQRKRIPLQSFEGFIRQVAGWREYARYYYIQVAPAEYRRNVFGMSRPQRPLPAAWKTPYPILNRAVADAQTHGYLHHIRRLTLAAYMTMVGVHPDAVFHWFYEFSLDSWDWVMVFNVYSMGTYSDGGIGMRKPYLFSTAYFKKQSTEPPFATAGEAEAWNAAYRAFFRKHAAILEHTELAGQVRLYAARERSET